MHVQSSGKLVSASQFERLAGRGAMKKWKQTIDVIDDENGEIVKVKVGRWLSARNITAPSGKEPNKASQQPTVVTVTRNDSTGEREGENISLPPNSPATMASDGLNFLEDVQVGTVEKEKQLTLVAELVSVFTGWQR